MKTILIIAGGMADVPARVTGGKTPLMMASKPELDTLAKLGCAGTLLSTNGEAPLSAENAVLSILGYDFSRGVPDPAVLEAFGSGLPFDPSALRFFVVPKFSGHGVVISDNPRVRGAAMTALMRPLFPVGEGLEITPDHPCGSLSDKARSAIKAIEIFDFVVVYADEAEAASLSRDIDSKTEAISRISSELIGPVADYVWNAKIQMNLVVMADRIVSWQTGKSMAGEVPAVVYFNDDPPYDLDTFDEEAVADGPLSAPLPGDLIRQLVSFEPYDDQES